MSYLSKFAADLLNGQADTPMMIAIATAAIAVSIPLVMKCLCRSKGIDANPNNTTVLLYGVDKKIDGPSPSGYCQKVETFLRATSTPYEHRSIMPTRAPRGKVPYSMIGGTVIPDSHFILQHLVRTNTSCNLDAVLTRSQLADSRSFQVYIEELIYPCIVWERFFNDSNFKILVDELFFKLPWPIRFVVSWKIRRNVRHTLWMHGVARHSDDEIYSFLTRFADDIEAKFTNGVLYFHATEKFTEIDIVIHAFLVNALGSDANPYISGLILERPKLVAFTKHMTSRLFPEYKHVLQRLEDAEGRLKRDHQ